MEQRVSITSAPVIFVEAFGFGVLLLLAWIDDSLILPYDVAAGWIGMGDWHDAFVDSIAITLVAALVLLTTYRLLNRIHQLEQFIVVCAWCRKINLDGTWVPFEDYVLKRANSQCTHGVCECCAAAFHEEARTLQLRSRSSGTSSAA